MQILITNMGNEFRTYDELTQNLQNEEFFFLTGLFPISSQAILAKL